MNDRDTFIWPRNVRYYGDDGDECFPLGAQQSDPYCINMQQNDICDCFGFEEMHSNDHSIKYSDQEMTLILMVISMTCNTSTNRA